MRCVSVSAWMAGARDLKEKTRDKKTQKEYFFTIENLRHKWLGIKSRLG
jgi:hypothetical protein